jgi:hypothetical protein
MELKALSAELDELRKVIISSNLTTCYLMLDTLPSEGDKVAFYEKFRAEWMDTYKHVYKIVSKMKMRKTSR